MTKILQKMTEILQLSNGMWQQSKYNKTNKRKYFFSNVSQKGQVDFVIFKNRNLRCGKEKYRK